MACRMVLIFATFDKSRFHEKLFPDHSTIELLVPLTVHQEMNL